MKRKPRMRLLVYEYMTARGIGRSPASPEHGMYREGRAMRDAVAEDFDRVPGVEVVTFADADAPVELAAFEKAVATANRALVIAPEADGILLAFAEAVARTRRRFLGPSPAAIRLASDKLALAEHWREHGVPTPAAWAHEPSPRGPFPVVWKPRDGAGSQATFLLRSESDIVTGRERRAAEGHTGPMIVQECVEGVPASVAFLCGPRGNVPLVPALQLLSDDGRFKYRGGELPMSPELTARAVSLGQCAVDCVPGLLGYVGVDLVLGGAVDGSRDCAIEINPRLTTSYVGLRALADGNLATAILAAAAGVLVGTLKWRPGRVRFHARGSVRSL